MQKVLLTIKGTQFENGENEYIEFVTEGRLYKSADGYRLEYDESELSGIEGVKTQLILENESVTLLRQGPIDTHMVFTRNRVFESNLSTPFGMMRMSILALRVDSELHEGSGSLNLEYEINMGDLSSVNKLDLSFRNVGDCIN